MLPVADQSRNTRTAIRCVLYTILRKKQVEIFPCITAVCQFFDYKLLKRTRVWRRVHNGTFWSKIDVVNYAQR